MQRVLVGLCILLLAACGGTGRQYIGATFVEPDVNGAIAGIDPERLTIVSDASANGYVYGLSGIVDPLVVGNSGRASAGDTAAYAVAGLLPTIDVGAPITFGSVSFTGEYQLVASQGYARTPNPNAWTSETFSGAMTATISIDREEFDANTFIANMRLNAVSDDGRLVFDNAIVFDLANNRRPANEPFSFGGGSGIVTYDDEEIGIRGEMAVGREAGVAAFTGQNDRTLIAGGFLLGANN